MNAFKSDKLSNPIKAQLDAYAQERNALLMEANERFNKHQLLTAEHNSRMAEIQSRVAQLQGAVEALEQLLSTLTEDQEV